jgi:hypothetical protein
MLRVPYVRLVHVGAIGAAVVLAAVPGASGSGLHGRSAHEKVTQKAFAVSLPRGVSGDVRPQVACPSAGNCVATFGTANLLVLGEHRGKWTREATLAGVGVRSLACPSIGSCVGTGWISGEPAAIVTQSGRSWHASAAQLPGNPSPSAPVLPSISCGAPGDCTAVGWYQVFNPGNIENHALLVDQTDGAWGAGSDAQFPPDAATTSDPDGFVLGGGSLSVVSCPSAGNCAAVGSYGETVTGQNGPVWLEEGWVTSEQAGQWGPGVKVQLPPDASTTSYHGNDPFIGFTGLSCPSAGNCTAVGGYDTKDTGEEGLILIERNGVWLQPIVAPLPRGGAAARSRAPGRTTAPRSAPGWYPVPLARAGPPA